MFSKINHVAIVSENYAVLEQFYRAVFGMASSARTRPGRAVTVGDGYVGLNINPRRAGRRPGLDHFGINLSLRLRGDAGRGDDAQCVVIRVEPMGCLTWNRRPDDHSRPLGSIMSAPCPPRRL